MRKAILLAATVIALAGLSLADEGMWLFNAPPSQAIQSKYNFSLTPAWLDHLRLASVRFNNGGSGSFVSANGLTFTNHHVGASCIQELSSGGKDYVKNGFYARTLAEEKRCPALELNVLQQIEDVTARVNAAVKPEMTPAASGQAVRSAMSQVEAECTQSSGLRCDVVTFYSGGMYHLYKYKKYTDVRLVFAPEFDIAFLGGDPDNFTYPRYNLDVTFFRVYENGKPAQVKDYLRWSTVGVKEGDLVFVSGHPGSTGRLLTMAQLDFLRDVQYPWQLKDYARRLEMLRAFSSTSDERARIAQKDLFSLENSQKAVTGYNSGLLDAKLMAKKAEEEKALRARVNADPAMTKEYGKAWENLEKAMQAHREFFAPYLYVERLAGLRGTLASKARTLVRLAEERKKPNAERMREYRESNMASLQQSLLSEAPVYTELEVAMLTDSLADMEKALPGHPAVQKVLAGKSPAERAAELIDGTKLYDVAARRQLLEGGEAAVNASSDALIQLMRGIEPEARTLRGRYDDEVEAVERANGSLIGKARFAQGGTTMPPDATFTLRLSYGAVKNSIEGGKPVPYFTTLGGTFDHAAANGNKPPYRVPDSWTASKGKMDLKTPFNFVSTPDIIGGNSGSPVVNTKNEVVGIIFDGNLASLPWRFVYGDETGRSVAVDARAVQETLRKVYGAAPLADELLGRGSLK